MTADTVKIPVQVPLSVETLEELQDALTAQNPKLMKELREARDEDPAGKSKDF
jgi:PHD/YefM family antitoxin component YafN of YafNO toxin-antitoxin module